MNKHLVTHTIIVSIDLADFMLANASSQSGFLPNHIRVLGNDIKFRLKKLADAMEHLTAIGFSVKWEKGAITAYSHKASASETKKLLAERGLRDRDYSIYLEYERSWGML